MDDEYQEFVTVHVRVQFKDDAKGINECRFVKINDHFASEISHYAVGHIDDTITYVVGDILPTKETILNIDNKLTIQPTITVITENGDIMQRSIISIMRVLLLSKYFQREIYTKVVDQQLRACQ